MTLNELWMCVLSQLGYTEGTVNERQIQAWIDRGYAGTNWNELAHQFWADGGTFGPNVNIALTGGTASCGFEPPTTTQCSANGDYTANDSGFTNPADTWLWTLEPPVAGVFLTREL